MSAAGAIYTPFETPYRMAMGLLALKDDEWFEIDADLSADLAEKDRLLADRHDEVCLVTPGSTAAQQEVLDIMAGHLPRHHGDIYRRDGHRMHIAGRDIPVDLTNPAQTPIERAARLVQEDLCVMERMNDAWCLTAATVCFPTRWRLADKIGQPLDAIHAPVPGFRDRMATPVARFFDHMKVARPVWRLNWSLVDNPALFQPGGHYRTQADPTLQAANAGERIWLRVERQTLRRLPQSDAILFTIRIHRWPLNVLAERPDAAARLKAAIETMPDPMRNYKSIRILGDAVVGYLEQAADVGEPQAGQDA